MTDRRRVLKLLAAISVSLAGSTAWARGSCVALLQGVDLEALRELGREYLSTVSEDGEVARVASLLESGDDATAIDALGKQASEDFAAGRLVALSGWFVSVTEARLYAALNRCGQGA